MFFVQTLTTGEGGLTLKSYDQGPVVQGLMIRSALADT